MTFLLLLRIVGIVLLVATLPLAMELLLLTIAAWVPARREAEDSERDFPLTVVIPAHNEQALIRRCVQSVFASAGQPIEVLVVAHNCTDATAAEASAAGAGVLVLNDPSQKGKGYALNAGFKAALSGLTQAVLVIDADSVVCSRMISAIKSRMERGARALQCRYEVENTQDSWRTNFVTLAFHAFNVIRPRGRASLGLSAGVFGNGFAIHRDLLEQIPYSSFSIVEDLQYHLELVCAGYRVDFVDTAVVRGLMPTTSRGAKSQRARWEGGRLQMRFKCVPRLLSEIVRGRTRLAEPVLDLLSLSISMEVCLLAVMALLPFAWARGYVAFALAILSMHVATAAIDGPGPWKTLQALISAPLHILWKISILPNIWRAAQPDTAWVRTIRGPANESEKPERSFTVKPIL